MSVTPESAVTSQLILARLSAAPMAATERYCV